MDGQTVFLICQPVSVWLSVWLSIRWASSVWRGWQTVKSTGASRVPGHFTSGPGYKTGWDVTGERGHRTDAFPQQLGGLESQRIFGKCLNGPSFQMKPSLIGRWVYTLIRSSCCSSVAHLCSLRMWFELKRCVPTHRRRLQAETSLSSSEQRCFQIKSWFSIY